MQRILFALIFDVKDNFVVRFVQVLPDRLRTVAQALRYHTH
jgi:hypothetical protein